MIDQVDPSSLRTIVLHKRAHQTTFGLYLADDYPQGIYILTIEPNSPADEAKIRPGDRLLAVNNQWVRSMMKNPKEIILHIAKYSRNLTVTIQPSDVFEWFLLIKEATSQRTIFIERDFERYVKHLVADEFSHFVDEDRYSKRRRRRRHRQPQQNKQTQTEQEFLEAPTQRTIPNMGTSQVLLRQSQSVNKSQTIETPNEFDGKRRIHLIRSADFQGFGFHVDSKHRRHLVYRLEPNSPAIRCGLRVNDVILQVNGQSTENMPTNTFVGLIKRSQTIDLLVENLSTMKNDDEQKISNKKKSLMRTFSRLTNRSSQETR